MNRMLDNVFIGYFNLLIGLSLTGLGWVSDIVPVLKAVSLLGGILMMVISGWQIYQRGRLDKYKRKELENKNKEEKE